MTDGEYLEIDGRPALRFVREYAHPAARVWPMLSDPDEMAHWFPARPSFDDDAPAVGGVVRFTFDAGQCDEPGGTGTVLAVDPPHRLAFSWEGDELWFDLVEVDGATRLTFTTVIDGADTAARNAAGWELCLVALDDHLAGAVHERRDWRPVYESYVAAGVPSGAPIPES